MTSRRIRWFGIALIASLVVGKPTFGQEELDDDRKILKYREATQTMAEPVYRRLNNIHESLAEDNYIEALSLLERMANLALNDYEEALVLQTYGFAYVQQGEHKPALEYFEKSLALAALPGEAQQGMLYSLAGLYLAEGQHLKAIETMRRWFRYEADPTAEAYMIIGTSFAELERYDDALPYVRKAIAKSEKPVENWYMLELAIHFEKERYRDGIAVLKKMVQFWPDNAKYWDMLVGAQRQDKQDEAALETMMLAYTKGLIDDELKIKSLVQLSMLQDIPLTGGLILEKEMSAGNVAATKENLELLLQAWLSAREYDRAVATIDRLGPLAEDGTYFMRKAGIHNELGEWAEIVVATEQALEKGLDDPSDAHILAGMAYVELNQFDKAISSFRKARDAGDDKQRANAAGWIEFVQEKIAVQQAARN